MNRLIILGLATTLGAAYTAMQGASVELQPTSPGTAQTGHLNISGTATVGILKSQNTVFGQSTAATGFAYGGYFTAASNQARGFYGYASSPTGLTYGGFFQNASESGRAVYGLATATTGFNYGGYFQTASTSGRGLLGVAAAPTGTTYGVYGTAVSPNGYGVYSDGNMGASGIISGNGTGLIGVNADKIDGIESHSLVRNDQFPQFIDGSRGSYLIRITNSDATGNANALRGEATDPGSNITYGLYGISNSTKGRGVFGSAPANSGTNSGVYGSTGSPEGYGVNGLSVPTTGTGNGVRGEARSPDGFGVYGFNTAQSGVSYGAYFKNSSPGGAGVYGYSTSASGVFGESHALSGEIFGVHGLSRSSNGFGVYGEASSQSGTPAGVLGRTVSNTGTGVWGLSFGSSGVNYGVRGSSSSPSGYGLWATGRTGASGTKSFRIDHPFNPENEYLLHYSAEGPEPLNLYTGNVTTDANGEAWVQLPDYFGEINKDFRYTLTVVDDTDSDQFVMAKVAREIRDNKFKIRTSESRIKVSWRVEGVRNDLWVRKYGAPVEVQKEAPEKGKYQHPELYGKPKEMGMDYRAMNAEAGPTEQRLAKEPQKSRRNK